MVTFQRRHFNLESYVTTRNWERWNHFVAQGAQIQKWEELSVHLDSEKILNSFQHHWEWITQRVRGGRGVENCDIDLIEISRLTVNVNIWKWQKVAETQSVKQPTMMPSLSPASNKAFAHCAKKVRIKTTSKLWMDINENQAFQDRYQQRSSQAWNSTCLALECFSLESSLVSLASQFTKAR